MIKRDKFDRNQLVLVVLLVLYIVGFFGIVSPVYKNFFLSLSPVILSLSLIAVLISIERPIKRTVLFIVFSGSIGFIAELIGVNTSILFGTYQYETNLGLKIGGAPLIIAANWSVLSIGAAHLSFFITKIRGLRVLLAATLMLLFDIIMEPVAIKSHYWFWEGGVIPIYNYVCWFVISVLIQFVYVQFIKEAPNKVFMVLFCIMLLFFILLNLF